MKDCQTTYSRFQRICNVLFYFFSLSFVSFLFYMYLYTGEKSIVNVVNVFQNDYDHPIKRNLIYTTAFAVYKKKNIRLV